MRRIKRQARKRQLRLSPEQSATLRKFAGMLEVRADAFLHWQLESLIDQLGDPEHGLLSDWAMTGLDYATPEGASRVNARVNAYLKGRERSAVGEEGAKP